MGDSFGDEDWRLSERQRQQDEEHRRAVEAERRRKIDLAAGADDNGDSEGDLAQPPPAPRLPRQRPAPRRRPDAPDAPDAPGMPDVPGDAGRWAVWLYGWEVPPSARRSQLHAAACWGPVLAVGILGEIEFGGWGALLAAAITLMATGFSLLKNFTPLVGFLAVLALLGYRFGPTGAGPGHGSAAHWNGVLVFLTVFVLLAGVLNAKDIVRGSFFRAAWPRWAALGALALGLLVAVLIFVSSHAPGAAAVAFLVWAAVVIGANSLLLFLYDGLLESVLAIRIERGAVRRRLAKQPGGRPGAVLRGRP